MISSKNFHTSKISEYVNYQLQPIVKEIPSYVQDTIGFFRKIYQIDFFPDNPCLVFVDVKSLHTNILNADRIRSAKTSLENYSK